MAGSTPLTSIRGETQADVERRQRQRRTCRRPVAKRRDDPRGPKVDRGREDSSLRSLRSGCGQAVGRDALEAERIGDARRVARDRVDGACLRGHAEREEPGIESNAAGVDRAAVDEHVDVEPHRVGKLRVPGLHARARHEPVWCIGPAAAPPPGRIAREQQDDAGERQQGHPDCRELANRRPSHWRCPRCSNRCSAHSSRVDWTAARVDDESRIGSRPKRVSSSSRSVSRSLVRGAPGLDLAGRQVDEEQPPAVRIDNGNDDALRAAGSSAPRGGPARRSARRPSRDRPSPPRPHAGGGTTKSEKTKTKLPAGTMPPTTREKVQRPVEVVRRRVEPAGEQRPRVLDEIAGPDVGLRPRRPPARGARVVLSLVACEVEIADETALVEGARDEDLGGEGDSLRFVQPRQLGRKESHALVGGRRRARRAAFPRRSARARRTRRCLARTRGAQTTSSRSCGSGRPAGRAANRRHPSPRRVGCFGSRRTPIRRGAGAGRAGSSRPGRPVRVSRLVSVPSTCSSYAARPAPAGRTRSRQRSRKRRERRARGQAPRLGEEGRREDDAVAENGKEEDLDVLGHDVLAPVEECPRARHPLEREARADRCAERDRLELTARLDELDDPAEDQLVGVDVFDRALELAHVVERDDRAQVVERVVLALLADDLHLLVDARVAERRSSGRSGRAAPPGAGTSPPARSGSRSRAAGTASGSGCGARRRSSPGARPSPRAAPTGSSASHG